MDDLRDGLKSGFSDELDVTLPPTVDRAAVERMQFVSQLLDESIEIPGTGFKIGLDPILGIVPGSGDVIAAGLSLYIVLESARLGVSYTTLLRMIANVAVDVAVGSVPVVGTIFDAFWKSNVWNLERALDDLAAADRPSDPDETPVTIEVE